MPAWISSTMSSAPVELARARASAKNSCVSGRMPPSPWMDSTRIAQTSLENFGAKIGDIVETNKLHAGNDWSEGLAVLGFVGGRHRAEGAAVEALLQGEKLCPDLPAFAAQQAGMGARQLHCAFPGLGAGVGEKHAIEAGALGEAQRQLGLALVIEEVRGVNERAALVDDGSLDGRVRVAERVHADAAQQVEIAHSALIDEVNALALHEKNRIAIVGLKQ